MKNVRKNVSVNGRQFATLLISSTIALSLSLGVMFQQFAGSTFTPLLKPSVIISVTVLYTLVVFMTRYLKGTVHCYLMQAVLATMVGFASETDLSQVGQKMDYRLVIVLAFVTMMAHNMCVDKILNRLGKIDNYRATSRLITCCMFSALIIGSYAYFVRHNPSIGVTAEKEEVLEVPRATAVNLPVAEPETQTKTVTKKVTEFFMGIYQNAREFEKVVKGSEVCGYPREWIEQLKTFENSPLHNGEVTVSKVHTDKLRPDVMEVGYGTTPGEIADAKRYKILPKDAEFPKSMTKEEADRWMEEVTIPTYDAMVRDKVKVDLTPEQRFALLSFCHNTGGGNLEKLVCSKNRLNSGNLECAPRLIRLYVNAGKHKNVGGLVKRRNWEASLFEESLGEVASN